MSWSNAQISRTGSNPEVIFVKDIFLASRFIPHIAVQKNGTWEPIVSISIDTFRRFLNALHISTSGTQRHTLPCKRINENNKYLILQVGFELISEI